MRSPFHLAKELAMTHLRQRMIEDMQVRNLAPHTQATYILHVSLFARHFRQSPELLGPDEIRDYQLYLTNQRKLASSSIIVTTAALRFLYNVTLKRGWNLEASIPAPRQPKKLPVVLSRVEVLHFLRCVEDVKHQAILTTCYAAGLRISEAVRLKTSSLDNQRMVIRVAQGKGHKDRYVMLSPKLLDTLRNYWRIVRPKEWLFPGYLDQPITRHAVGVACREARVARACRNPSRPIPCGTPLPFICLKPAPTFAPFNCCSVTAAWRPRPST